MASTTGDFVLYTPKMVPGTAYLGVVIGPGLINTIGRWVWFRNVRDGVWSANALFIPDDVLQVLGSAREFGISDVHLVTALGELVDSAEWAKR